MRNLSVLTVLCVTAALLLAGCDEMSDESATVRIRGKWRPVYAEGSYEDAVYVHSYAGPVNNRGEITSTITGKQNPEVKYESTIMFSGYEFFSKGGSDYHTAFFLAPEYQKDNDMLPLLYKIEDGKIYFEFPKSYFINDSGNDYYGVWHPDLQEGSGIFSEGRELIFIDYDNIRIGPVTYSRVR